MKGFFLSLFGLLILTIDSFKCPPETFQIPNEDVCMYVSNETEFYLNVVRRCEAFGGIPAKVTNVFENAYVAAVIPQNLNGLAPYIGVERQKNNIWTYADGSPLTYQNWALNEPNNNSTNSTVCAILDPQSAKWVSAGLLPQSKKRPSTQISNAEFYIDAARRCEVLGGIAAKILNVFESAYVFAVIPQSLNGVGPYIGVERKKNNIWTYADGSPLTYQNWALNEPNNNLSNSTLCAIMDPQSGKWATAECSFARPFLCSINGDEFQCPDGWVYNETFDYCYYLQNFTYPDAVHWQLYNVTTAEANCQRMGSHLVSIHSKAENDFVYSLVTSNVKSLTIAAPNNNSCAFQRAWIGYYGNGTLGTGTWTDGTQFDYIGQSPYSTPFYWLISNDPSCNQHQWAGTSSIVGPIYARFVCKMPSKSRVAKEKLKKENFKNL